MTAYLGEISVYAENRLPSGWALCDGTLLPIAQYTALFSLLGTYYGGDGQTTFGLPDLRGRIPIHQGKGAGLSTYLLGQKGGAEEIVLNFMQIGSHNHTLLGSNGAPSRTGNTGVLAAAGIYAPPDNSTTQLASASIEATGPAQNLGHANQQPHLSVNFIMCIAGGVYPSRS